MARKRKTIQKIEQRIESKDVEIVPVDDVLPHPRNARDGDVGAISLSLGAHGQYRPIVVNRRTRHICAGNHTWKAAVALGWHEIAVTWVDVDDDEELQILLVDNRTNDLASYNEQGLADLLSDLASRDALDGTGYDGDDVDALLAKLNGPPLQQGGNDEIEEQFQIIVMCADEQAQTGLLERLQGEGYECRALVS